MHTFRSLVLGLVLVLSTAPLAAYTIYLTDGSRLVAREAYRVEDDQAIITLPNGTRTSIALSEIDVPRTRRANQVDYGDAVVVDEDGSVGRVPTAPPDEDEPSLTEIARRNRSLRSSPDPEDPAEPEPTTEARLPRTPAGNVDLLRANRVPISSVEIGSLLSEVLRNQGVESASLYQGTRPNRIFIDFSTNSEAAVFRALEASARALLEAEQQRPGAVEALELFMATDQRQRAGQFLMTPDRARELIGRQIDLPGYYLKYVQF